MSNCLVCFGDASQTPLPCECEFCSECLSAWMEAQILDIQFQDKGTVICLNETCKKPFNPSDVLHKIEREHQSPVDNALLKAYLSKTSDVRMCPNASCSYGGIINLKEKCKNSLECEQCNKKWREKIHYGWLESLIFMVMSFQLVNSDFLSDMWEEFFATRCPGCNIPITKNGGCPHMTCRKCNYEFCWFCVHPWRNHKPELCSTTILSKTMIYGFMVFGLLMLTGLIYPLRAMIWGLVKFLVKILVYDSCIWGIAITGYELQKRCRMRKNRQKTVLLFGMIIALLLVLTFILWWWDLFSHLLYCILGQGGIACVIALYVVAFDSWAKKVY